jgi:hypothetical protein
MLKTNLALRELGIEEVLALRGHEPRRAAVRASELRAFDPHLAEVAQLVGALLASAGRKAPAAGLFDLAAQLSGPDTEEGRASLARAHALREGPTSGGAGSAPAAPAQSSPAR